ncbi:MAG: hypothetical protein KGK01_12760 [Bradyrhizobium sp.]|uniref:hypothetical protein n=1 Tax=Bradyrhizobium sp. TaxID=376 RepID=UPI00239DA218|nr:hypothetical protein [Bradyrhizobium sp.]MDE2067294.1 hypothetical protein [Bradyrhizobium sp.]MDE2243269.1 hypothetical protein [Bradyrhizobium sp.]MDE2468455.1 hypothetical protein [Bradyrhizobium sp.]
MKPLILTSLHGLQLKESGRAKTVIAFCFKFAWGQLPPPDKLDEYLGPHLPKQERGDHWSCFIVGRLPPEQKDCQHLSLAEFCRPYKSVELWFDSEPVDQLQLIWLLDGLRSDPETVAKLKLRLVSYDMLTATPEQLAKWRVPVFKITPAYLELASTVWQAYRASMPEAFFGLLRRDLSRFPMLQPAMIDLVEELPSASTGLGATEMRLLELVAAGYAHTNDLFYLRSLGLRGVFSDWELRLLIAGLAHGRTPALMGLDDEIRGICQENYYRFDDAFRRSRLSLTDFGRAVLAHEEDFSRHNPIDRWWGGTHLTNDNLWRYDPVLIPPVRQ